MLHHIYITQWEWILCRCCYIYSALSAELVLIVLLFVAAVVAPALTPLLDGRCTLLVLPLCAVVLEVVTELRNFTVLVVLCGK